MYICLVPASHRPPEKHQEILAPSQSDPVKSETIDHLREAHYIIYRALYKIRTEVSLFKQQEKKPFRALKYKAFLSSMVTLSISHNVIHLLFNVVLNKEKLKYLISINYTIHLYTLQ